MSRETRAKLKGVVFRKSSWSEPNMNCVEIGHARPVFAVRDSKAIPSPVLTFAPEHGRVFLGDVRVGRFNR
jgi:hypothetical protein